MAANDDIFDTQEYKDIEQMMKKIGTSSDYKGFIESVERLHQYHLEHTKKPKQEDTLSDQAIDRLRQVSFQYASPVVIRRKYQGTPYENLGITRVQGLLDNLRFNSFKEDSKLYLEFIDPSVQYKDFQDLTLRGTAGAAQLIEFIQNETVQKMMKDPSNAQNEDYGKIFNAMQHTFKKFKDNGGHLEGDAEIQINNFFKEIENNLPKVAPKAEIPHKEEVPEKAPKETKASDLEVSKANLIITEIAKDLSYPDPDIRKITQLLLQLNSHRDGGLGLSGGKSFSKKQKQDIKLFAETEIENIAKKIPKTSDGSLLYNKELIDTIKQNFGSTTAKVIKQMSEILPNDPYIKWIEHSDKSVVPAFKERKGISISPYIDWVINEKAAQGVPEPDINAIQPAPAEVAAPKPVGPKPMIEPKPVGPEPMIEPKPAPKIKPESAEVKSVQEARIKQPIHPAQQARFNKHN